MPVSSTQRQAIMAGLNEGLGNQDIAARVGVSPGQVAAVKAHVSMGTYGDAGGAADAEVEVANAVDTAFGLERDLQMALRRNIDQLESGLTITDGDKEQIVASGRIDITARDRDGASVIIELKVGTADREAVGQLLAYMGDLMEKNTQVRGILIAREFAPRAVSAARVVPSLRLVQYGFRFTFETVSDQHT
jgi:hypothetical protein